jgi:hypothetical protein
MLQFIDSVRDSVISYLEQDDPSSKGMKRVDTPTRLLNNSNEFLPLASYSIDLRPKNNNEDPILTPRREFNDLKQKLEKIMDS